MKDERRYFQVTPKIILADTTVEVTIKPLAKHEVFDENSSYEVTYYTVDKLSSKDSYQPQEKSIVRPHDGVLKIKQHFYGEQEHVIQIENMSTHKTYSFNFYSLHEDLFNRRPYKGDLHMHSYHSDGKESPGFVAASCRRIGLDFMALTDHGRYFPSLECQKEFEGVSLDMLIARGEEVHPENNPNHMINFGGSFSVNELMKNDPDTYYAEVAKIEKTLTSVQDDHVRYVCASSMWCFDKIREGKGLSIFCHPYWIHTINYNISEAITSFMYEYQPYDANEVLGGYHPFELDSNILQVARYYEERANGKEVPIVGVSDAHGCESSDLFGRFYTIAFAPSNEQQDIITSIKDLYSVAVEEVTDGTIRPVGPFRLVRYALYLSREIFPLHDELCMGEGLMMLRYLSGHKEAGEELARLKGQVNKLYNDLWA